MAEVGKAQVIVIYEGRDITQDISQYLSSTSYTDNVHGKADEIDLSFKDDDGLFQNDWYPDKKAKVQVKIRHDGQEVNAGTFYIGEVTCSGPPDLVNWHCTSLNPDTDLRTKKSSNFSKQSLLSIAKAIAKNHDLTLDDGSRTITTALPPTDEEQAKLVKLAELFLSYSNEPNTVFFYNEISSLLMELEKVLAVLEIKGYGEVTSPVRQAVGELLNDKAGGENSGTALQTRRLGASKMSVIITTAKAQLRVSPTEVRQTLNSGIGRIMVDQEIQHQETDLEFLLKLSNKYGFTFNIKPPYMIFYSSHQLCESKSVTTINKGSVGNWSISDKLHDTYTDVNVSSHNPIENETINNGTTIPNTAAEQGNLTFLSQAMRAAAPLTEDNRAIHIRKIVDTTVRTANGLTEKGLSEGSSLIADYNVMATVNTTMSCNRFADFCDILKKKLIKLQASGNKVTKDKDAYAGGQSNNTLQVRTKAENQEQADAIAKAALYNTNSETRTGSFTCPGSLLLLAGNNFDLEGVGKLSQKYNITKSTHEIQNGGEYTTSVEFKAGPIKITTSKKGKVKVS